MQSCKASGIGLLELAFWNPRDIFAHGTATVTYIVDYCLSVAVLDGSVDIFSVIAGQVFYGIIVEHVKRGLAVLVVEEWICALSEQVSRDVIGAG